MTSQTDYEAPSDEDLREQALTFLKTCKKKEYRQLRRDGELEEMLALKVRAAKSQAEGLQHSGVWAGEAWNRAIRSAILESESD